MTRAHKTNLSLLEELLTYRRAHNSVGERQYVHDHILPLNPTVIHASTGEVMAFVVYVGKSEIMFTSHTDTVHMNHPEVRQEVFFKDGRYYKEDNQPLGADDAAGNWLMFNMIQSGVPGIYAFFRGEERGGIGSSYCAKHRTDLFESVRCAIAFDRRGTQSIITHQGAGRGCSDEFGRSLAAILKMGHELDPTGIYTDTAEFFHLVPNCTNISVGYLNEHTKKETLNKGYLEMLRDQLLMANWDKLDHTPPIPDVPDITASRYGISMPLFDSSRVVSDMPDLDVNPLQFADFMFDYADVLPSDLRDKALRLAQRIYKRFEG